MRALIAPNNAATSTVAGGGTGFGTNVTHADDASTAAANPSSGIGTAPSGLDLAWQMPDDRIIRY